MTFAPAAPRPEGDARAAAPARRTLRARGSSELWRLVHGRLRPGHEARACREYLESARVLGDAFCLPTPAAVSARVRALTGFRIERAHGPAGPRAFFARLARGVFTAAPSVRPPEDAFFSPRPDWMHDAIGHAVLLAHPRGAQLYRLFGRAYRADMGAAELARLSRLFWHAAEAGVVRERGRRKALGGALLSSVEELDALDDIEVLPFDAERVAHTPFDDSRPQRVVFGARSLAQLHAELERYLAPPRDRSRCALADGCRTSRSVGNRVVAEAVRERLFGEGTDTEPRPRR